MPGHTPAPRSPFRVSAENASRGILSRLHALPRPVVPLLTVALIAVGVLAGPAIATVALLLVFVFVLWLAYLSWPVVSAGGRAIRILMLVLVAGMIAIRLWPA